MASKTFHTIYPAYRTAVAVKAADNGDFIVLNSSDWKLFGGRLAYLVTSKPSKQEAFCLLACKFGRVSLA
jgi:hypothetical protein